MKVGTKLFGAGSVPFNNRRKKMCPNRHPYSGDNLDESRRRYWSKKKQEWVTGPHRNCIQCRRERQAAWARMKRMLSGTPAALTQGDANGR